MPCHAVVDAASRQNDFGMVAHLLCFLCQVVGVDANAMPSHQSGREVEEVPFGSCSFQHILCVNPEEVEYFRQFVYKRNVDVALCVFDHFCRFRHFYGGCEVRAGSDY